MKKLIIIAIVLAIGGPAVALVWPPHSPGFACCPGSGEVIWEFLEDGCMPTSYYFPYGPANDLTFGTRYEDGGPVWTWSDGKYTVIDAGGGTEDSLNQPIPDSGGKSYLRMYFEVVHTIVESEDLSFIGLGLELWNMQDWLGCPAKSEDTGEYGGGYEFPAPTEQFDIGGGWHQSIWVADFSDDGSVGEGTFDLSVATHTTAIIGMVDEGGVGFDMEEVYISYIWFNDPDGSDIPTLSCCYYCCPPPRRIIVDVNDIPIYEPQDAGGPAPEGPTDGQLQVSLAWRPGGNLGYPPFTAKVVINPDPNNEVTPNADFYFSASTEPNGVVRLIFNETNWDQYQNVHVAATADLLREGNEAFNVELTVTIDIDDPNFGSDPCSPVTQRRGIIVVDNDITFISVLPYGALKDVLTENNPGVPVCVDVTLSHQPTDNVEILVARESDFELLLESMSVIDPNHLLFTPGNYNTPQQICLEARDDDENAEPWLEWVPGVILLNGFSDDIRYQSSEDGGELDIKEIDFNVQDNDCGAWGYDHRDVNHDCYVNLGDVALLYSQWLMCVQPYGDGCDKIWNLLPPP